MLKPHKFRELVNELRQTARQFHNYGCLRELIAGVCHKYIEVDAAMGKKETQRVVNKFIDETQKKLKIHKIENIGQAMPDLVCMNRKATTFWLEAKHLEALPKRETTCPLKGHFEKGQQGWGRSWNSWGGFHFVLLRVNSGPGAGWYLFSVSHGDLEEKTWEQLKSDSMVTEGLDNIKLFLEYL